MATNPESFEASAGIETDMAAKATTAIEMQMAIVCFFGNKALTETFSRGSPEMKSSKCMQQ